MTQQPHQAPQTTLSSLRWRVGLTWAGLFAERLAKSLWPLWTLALLVLGGLMLGVHEALPIELFWAFAVAIAIMAIGFLWRGFRTFRLPRRAEAWSRVDARLPGRPIQALMDAQAIGPSDPASVAIWQAHQARMAERARAATAVGPHVRLSRNDPYALRFVAALVFAVALLFGSLWRVATVTDLQTGGPATLTSGPVWEGWIEPPAYTGKPSLYLADQPDVLAIPEGSRLSLRLYGEVGALTVAETISGRLDVASAADIEQSFTATRDGTLEIAGPGGRAWDVSIIKDARPTAEVTGAPDRSFEGNMTLPFKASDDYEITGGTASITLDMGAVDRRLGYAADPEPRAPIQIDVPLPFTGKRDAFEDQLIGDFSQHPFANMPVQLALTVTDAAGQTSEPNITHMELPGRRFFDPMAAAIIEQRHWLLWSASNAPQVTQILRAVSHRPEDVFRSQTAYLRLRVILRRMETQLAFDGFDAAARDEAAAALWDLAVLIEEGDVEDALERMRRAQERLSEAMKNGASDDEIAELMEELRRANENYLNQLRREAARNQDQQNQNGEQSAENQNSMTLNQEDLQAMMDRIQELMEQGRMAEAEQALRELQEMMENMQIAEGQQGQGQQSEGEQAMEGLADSLRQQQGLSDQAFRDLQEQFNPGAQAGENQGNEGRNGGQGRGQSHEGQQGEGQGEGSAEGQGDQRDQNGQAGNGSPSDLAQRQEQLRREVERQRGRLPGAGSEAGEAAREALRRAEEAMRGAGDALEQNDLPGAIDRQAEAMDALREGMRSLGEAVADAQRNRGEQGTAEGQRGGQQQDPLGRAAGATGQAGTDEQLLQGEDVYRRARELLDEIRRRSGEGARTDEERDYLKRLLDRF